MIGRSMIRRLCVDQQGVAVLELALTAPILALIVVGVADLSNAYSRKLALEQAAQRSIEKIMQTTATTTPEATVKAEAVAQAGGGLTADDVQIVYKFFCMDASGTFETKTDYDADTCGSGKSEARYLSVVVTDEYQPMFPIHFRGINAQGKYPIRAEAGMRIAGKDTVD